MSDASSASSGGISAAGMIGVAFVVLKLTNVVGWSWWWVTAPFWGGLALLAAVGLIGIVCVGIVAVVKGIWS